MTVATIAHECFHLVCAVAKFIGMPLSEDSEEAWAYMLGDVTESVIAEVGTHRADGRRMKRR